MSILIGIIAFIAGFLWGCAFSNKHNIDVGIPHLELNFDEVDSDFDEHFKKHIDTYADKHPTLLVRQLATRLRKAWNNY